MLNDSRSFDSDDLADSSLGLFSHDGGMLLSSRPRVNLKLDAFPPPAVILPSTIFSLVTRISIFNRISFILRSAYQNKLYCHGGFTSDQDAPKERQRQQTIINSAYRAVSLHPLLSRLCQRKYLSHSFWA